MIEHELLLLGLLRGSPKHGYEIKRTVEGMLSLFAGVHLKSIYYPLRVLEKKGLIIKRTAKLGKRPQRLVYELTREGRARFEELLNKSFLNFKRPQFSLDMSLYFLDYVQPDIIRRRLRGRVFILNKIAKDIKTMIENRNRKKFNPSLSRILEHNLRMLEAESQFLRGLIKTI